MAYYVFRRPSSRAFRRKRFPLAAIAAGIHLTAAQTLGALGQTDTGTVIVSATAPQTLGALVQALTAGAVDTATVSQALPALGQTATASQGSAFAANQVLGALQQVATAAVPEAAIASQMLGALGQVTTGAVSDAAIASQILGAIGQTATAISGSARNIQVGPDFSGDFGAGFATGNLPGLTQTAQVTVVLPPPNPRDGMRRLYRYPV